MALPTLSRSEQVTPPAPAAPREARIPQPSEKTLANGLRVIVIQKRNVPLVSVRLMVKNGGEADPADMAGLADMTASLLTKGTKTRTAEQIAQGVEALGATIESGAGWDSSMVNLGVMSPKLGQAMEFVADVVRNPVFKQDEIDRLREQNVDNLQILLNQPASLAGFVATKVVYGDAAYGHALSGTPESLARVTREAIVGFHDRYFRPSNAVLVIGGDVTAAEGFAIAEKVFGGWKNKSSQSKVAEAKSEERARQPRVVVVDMPEAGQAAVSVMRKGLRRVDPAYAVALVTNSVLGGGYSARLNQEIRIKRGLSYGARSSFDLRREPGPFTATTQTKNESAAEVAGIIVDQMTMLGSVSLAESELTPRKAVLIGNFGRDLETSAGLVGRISTLALYGLELASINRYISGVQGVGGADVRNFAAANLTGNTASVIIVGDAKQFLEPLKRRFPNVEVIPFDQLDVNSAGLRKK